MYLDLFALQIGLKIHPFYIVEMLTAVAQTMPVWLLNWAFFAMGVYDSTRNMIGRFYTKCDQLFTIAFSPAYYIFFEGYWTPYLYSRTNPWASASAAPTMLYNYDTNVFFPYTVYNSMFDNHLMSIAKPIPILSLDIIDSAEKVRYDLTDFIETMRYIQYDNSQLPTLAQIVAAWSLSSHIVLDSSRFSIRYINQYGDALNALLDDANDITQSYGDEETESEETEEEESAAVMETVPDESAAVMETVSDESAAVMETVPDAPMTVKCKCHSWPVDLDAAIELHAAIDEFNKACPECTSRVDQTLPTITGILASATGAPTKETTMVETPTVERISG